MRIVFMITLAALVSGLTACTEIINLDINSSDPILVVTGEITDQSALYTINLSQSINFDENNVFPPVTGASITVNDNAGHSERLTETSPGNYTGRTLQGTSGRIYNAEIISNGKIYNANSVMSFGVPLEKVIADTTNDHPGDDSRGYQVNVTAVFTDAPGVVNYYRLVSYINGIPKYNEVNIVSDYLQDGETIKVTVARGDTISRGDTIMIALETIDAEVYNYYRILKEVTRTKTGISAAVPGNPVTNIKNNKAQGVFSAHAVRFQKVVAP